MENQIQNSFAMRTLSTPEISRIDQRLESLKIYYLEIHHEIRDHYFTELEKKPQAEFETTFQQLNEAFSWSVVRKMEKELRKATIKQIGDLQRQALLFWELRPREILVVILILGSLVTAYSFFGFSAIFSGMGIIAIVGSVIIWTKLGWRKSLNFSLTRHKPISGHSAAMLIRLSFVYGFFTYAPMGIGLSGGYEPNPIFSTLFISLGLTMTIYLLTLVKVTVDKKIKTA